MKKIFLRCILRTAGSYLATQAGGVGQPEGEVQHVQLFIRRNILDVVEILQKK